MDRREFLKSAAAAGVLGLTLPGLRLGAAEPPRRKGARSVIEIWAWGGPSHLDTFDPKPGAGKAYNGGYGAIPTNVTGIEISEFLPNLAQQMDKFSIIRSMSHGNNGHETAAYLMQTGRLPGGGITYPAIGAVIAMFKEKEYQGRLPAYIALTGNKGRFSENGLLSDRYRPLATGGNPNAPRFQVDGFTAPGNVTAAEVERRMALAAGLDVFGRSLAGLPELEAFDRAGREAGEIMQGSDAKAFDLNLESKEMRERYGRNVFGQSCLAARRLVEAGVPYITINSSGWDSHKKHFETMKQRTADMDKGFAALLEDLAEKGLLDSTIVWWSGEFGRTPKVDYGEPWNGGRGHHGHCFSAVVAGGGFAGGRVLGESDARGEYPVSRPVSPTDFLWSIYELAGVEPGGKLPNPRGLDLTILPPEAGKTRIKELYA